MFSLIGGSFSLIEYKNSHYKVYEQWIQSEHLYARINSKIHVFENETNTLTLNIIGGKNSNEVIQFKVGFGDDIKNDSIKLLKGSYSNDKEGLYGQKGEYSEYGEYHPGARADSSMWVLEEDVFLFGGIGYDLFDTKAGSLNDMWQFNKFLEKWKWISGKNVKLTVGYTCNEMDKYDSDILPSSRYNAKSFVINEDEIGIFGGYALSELLENGFSNQIWVYKISINQWKLVSGSTEVNKRGVFNKEYSTEIFPGGRKGHFAHLIAVNDSNSLVIGLGRGYGKSAFGYLSDVWKFDFDQGEWEFLSGEDNPNTNFSRGSFQSWYVQENNMIFIFGGKTFGEIEVDSGLYGFDLNINEWIVLVKSKKENYENNGSDQYPRVRENGGSIIINRDLILFGGKYTNSVGNDERMNDLWSFNLDSLTWNLLQGSNKTNVLGKYGSSPDTSNIIGGRNSFSLSNYNNGDIFLFGGEGMSESFVPLDESDLFLNDLWRIFIGEYCYFKDQTSFDVCNGNGECTDLNQCDCFKGYFEKDCSVTTCFGVFSNDSEVCSNSGVCSKSDVCDCDYGHFGDDCQSFGCFGISNNSELVCSGNGTCLSTDNCLCYEENWFGSNCQEYISYALLFEEKNIEIDYRTDLETSSKYLNYSLSCSDVIQNYYEYLENSKCLFTFFNSTIESLLIYYEDNSIEKGDILYFKSLTKKEELIILNLEEGSDSILSTLIIITSFCLIFLFTFTFSLIIFILACISAFCIYKKNKKFLKKLEELDIDLLLEEKELEKSEVRSLEVLKKLNKNLFEIDKNDLKLIKVLGEGGGNATVFKVKWKQTICAYKIFKMINLVSLSDKEDKFDEVSFEGFEREVSIMSKISHPYCLAFFGATLIPPKVGIVMEYCENGTINEFISLQSDVEMKEIIRFAKQIAGGMEYLHSKDIIHRDLKPQNVLLDSKFDCKICDFGISKVHKKEQDKLTTRIGTSYYIAPEVWKNENYTNLCDVFSYGIMLFQMLSCDFKNPYPKKNNEFSLENAISNDENFRPDIKILEKEILNQKSYLDFGWVVKMLPKMWGKAEKRPSFSEILKVFEKENSEKEIIII